jgi:hypothetical protein
MAPNGCEDFSCSPAMIYKKIKNPKKRGIPGRGGAAGAPQTLFFGGPLVYNALMFCL